MCLFPLWTSKVWPTNSGMIVHARAQVLMGCLARFSLSLLTLRYSFSSTNGPFLALLLMFYLLSCYLPSRCVQNNETRNIKYSLSAAAADACRIFGDEGSAFRCALWDCG